MNGKEKGKENGKEKWTATVLKIKRKGSGVRMRWPGFDRHL
jgi:hypothetical protein